MYVKINTELTELYTRQDQPRVDHEPEAMIEDIAETSWFGLAIATEYSSRISPTSCNHSQAFREDLL